MKKLLLLLFVTTLFNVNAQSSSFERGFRDGYCQAKKEDKGHYTPCAVSPIAPIPKVGKESYQDGFSIGMETYKKKNKSKANSTEWLGMAGKAYQSNDSVSGNNQAFSDGYNSVANQMLEAQKLSSKRANERAALMSEPSEQILVPLNTILDNYNSIAIVIAQGFWVNDYGTLLATRNNYRNGKDIKRVLSSSIFEIIIPKDYDKKKWRKNREYLKNVKDTKWLYLYITTSVSGVNKITNCTIKDYNNKIVYSSESINKSLTEILRTLINY